MSKTILAALLLASTAAAYEALSTGRTEAVPVAVPVSVPAVVLETPRQGPSGPGIEPVAASGVIRDAPSDGGYSYYAP